MQYLPTEIICNIIELQGNPEYIANCMLVSHKWYQIVRHIGRKSAQRVISGEYKTMYVFLIYYRLINKGYWKYLCNTYNTLYNVNEYDLETLLCSWKFLLPALSGNNWEEFITICFNMVMDDLHDDLCCAYGVDLDALSVSCPDWRIVIMIHGYKIRIGRNKINFYDEGGIIYSICKRTDNDTNEIMDCLRTIGISSTPEEFIKKSFDIYGRYRGCSA